MKSKIRKIVGDCYNQIRINDVAMQFGGSIPLGGDISTINPNIFRVASSWYGTREEMLRLLNASLSGPSGTVTSQLGQNSHLWPMGGCRHRITLRNPTNYGVRFKLYAMHLKCDDPGYVPGVYSEPTLPFATGSAFTANNIPTSSYWKFFNQDSREGGGGNLLSPCLSDPVFATNIGGAYTAPTANSAWESSSTGTTVRRFDVLNTPLSWVFPDLRRKLNVKLIGSGRIPGGGSQLVKYSAPMPPELRPRDYIADSKTNFSKYSYFFFLRAESDPTPIRVLDDTKAAVFPDSLYYSPAIKLPAQLIIDNLRTFRFRASGDSLPTFQAAWEDNAVASNGWLGSSSGFLEQGTYTASGVKIYNFGVQGPHMNTPLVNAGQTTAFASSVHSVI